MVPVFFHKDINICKNVIKACYDGGVRVFEFTNRGDFAHEIFGELVKWADAECRAHSWRRYCHRRAYGSPLHPVGCQLHRRS